VNCFQTLYLWLSETILILNFISANSCELLSNFVSLTIWNNIYVCKVTTEWVVNCFQTLYLWLSETMLIGCFRQNRQLWIAFKLCIFDYLKQFRCWSIKYSACCELLSNFVSLTIWNNANKIPIVHIRVVNCFQTLYLWLSETI